MALMLPFRVMRPPVLETPITTIRMPSTNVTVPLLILSFFVIIGGVVFCAVTRAPIMSLHRNDQGRVVASWMSKNDVSHQCVAEGIVFAAVVTLGALSAIAAAVVMREQRTGLAFAYLERFAFTLPIWVLLCFEVFVMKMPSYTLDFQS